MSRCFARLRTQVLCAEHLAMHSTLSVIGVILTDRKQGRPVHPQRIVPPGSDRQRTA